MNINQKVSTKIIINIITFPIKFNKNKLNKNKIDEIILTFWID